MLNLTKDKLIAFFDGKGGAGKSTFLLLVSHYLDQRDKAYRVVNTDTKNNDLSDFFKDGKVSRLQLTDDRRSKETDLILNAAVGEGNFSSDSIGKKSCVALVNLPGGDVHVVNKWIKELGGVEALRQGAGVDCIKFFLSNGDSLNLQIFKDSLNDSNGKLPHVLVRNFGLDDMQWGDVGAPLSNEWQELVDEYEVSYIDMPACNVQTMADLWEQRIRFQDALDNWGFADKSRIFGLVNPVVESLDSVGIFDLIGSSASSLPPLDEEEELPPLDEEDDEDSELPPLDEDEEENDEVKGQKEKKTKDNKVLAEVDN